MEGEVQEVEMEGEVQEVEMAAVVCWLAGARWMLSHFASPHTPSDGGRY